MWPSKKTMEPPLDLVVYGATEDKSAPLSQSPEDGTASKSYMPSQSHDTPPPNIYENPLEIGQLVYEEHVQNGEECTRVGQ